MSLRKTHLAYAYATLWYSCREAPIRSQPTPSWDPSRLKNSDLGATRLRSMYQPFETTLSEKTRDRVQRSASHPTTPLVLFWFDNGHPSSKSPKLIEFIPPLMPGSDILIRKCVYLDMPSSERSKAYLIARTKLVTTRAKRKQENLRVFSNGCSGRMVYKILLFELVIATILFEFFVSQPPVCRTR